MIRVYAAHVKAQVVGPQHFTEHMFSLKWRERGGVSVSLASYLDRKPGGLRHY